MGIFDRHKIPKPHIIVELDDECRGPVRPGSQVAGLATAQTPVQRNLQSARILFTGTSITHATRTQHNAATNTNQTIHYHDEAALFTLDQVVAHQTTMQPDVPFTWRFAFRFPAYSAEVVGESPYAGQSSSQRGLFQETAHILPPTFAYERSQCHYARVEYAVQAEFIFEDAADRPLIIPLAPFQFCPARPVGDFSKLAEFSRPMEIYASSRLIGEQKSMMNSLKDKFSRETPHVMVGIKCSVPQYFTPGVNFPIYACVELENASHEKATVQSVAIRIKSMKLHPTTFWRALRESGFGYHREKEEDDEQTVLLNSVPESLVAEARHDERPKGRLEFPAAFEARLPGTVCPSFETFNVANTYTLKIVLEAEVAEKEFELKWEGSVRVLPP